MRKGVAVWLFSTLSFITAIHTFEAALWLFLDREAVLIKIYPVINELFTQLNITPTVYFTISAFLTFIFWGLTCLIALENPIERFINQVLSDAKKQSEMETEFIEDNKTTLDMICETLTENSRLLAEVRDLAYNVRAELSAVKPLMDGIEKITAEIGKLKKEMGKIKVEIKKSNICPSCNKEILPEFNVCPYCGENLKLLPQKVLKAYK